MSIITRLQYISVELCICTATVASYDCHHVSVKSCVAEQSVLEPYIKMTASVVRIDHCQISGWIWSAVSHSGPPLLVETLVLVEQVFTSWMFSLLLITNQCPVHLFIVRPLMGCRKSFFTPSLIINHPLSTFSIYYDP